MPALPAVDRRLAADVPTNLVDGAAHAIRYLV
jgi:hypothetical protein